MCAGSLGDMRGAVTSFLRCSGRFLILRRSAMVDMPGLWAGVSGGLEGCEDPLHRARTEILEETGKEDVRLAGRADPCTVEAGGGTWLIHPFLFDAAGTGVRLNWENDEYRWVRREEINSYETVPSLAEILGTLL